MATRLEDFREKYPGLNDVDDENLSNAIHAKYYPDADFNEFKTQLGEASPSGPAPTDPALTRPDRGVSAADLGRTLVSGGLEGSAALIEGAGEIERRAVNFVLGESNRVLGTDFGQMANRGDFFARPLRAGAESLAAGVSEPAQRAMQASTPRGNILEGEFDFGEDPSVGGFLMQGANVAGQLAPALAGGAVTAGLRTAAQLTGLAGITAAQGGGAALNEESNRVRQLPQQDLNRMPGYIDLVAEGKTLDEAREQLAVDAGESAFNLAAPVGAGSGLLIGAGLSRPIQNLMSRLVGTGAVARGAATALAEAPLEGAQEVAEGVAARFGGALATGEDRELGEGSAAEFLLGTIGGGIGGAGGAFRRPGTDIDGEFTVVDPSEAGDGFQRPRPPVEQFELPVVEPLDVTPTPAQLEQAAAEAPARTSTRTEVEIDGEVVEQPAAVPETPDPVQDIENHVKEQGFDVADMPFTPIRPEWEDFPIVQAIRKAEAATGQQYERPDPVQAEAAETDQVDQQVEAIYAEVNQPVPEASVDTAIVKDDLQGLEGTELTKEIRQLRDDELLQRAGIDAPITNEATGEFLDPHQARVAQLDVQREAGLEQDRRGAGLTEEQVNIMRANQTRRQTVEQDFDPTFEGFFRRGERHKTVLRAQQWAEQTQGQAIYVEADIRNLSGLNAEKGTAGADAILNETGQVMLRAMQEIGAEKVIPIRRGGDEVSFVVINGDPAAVQTAIDNAETQVDALAQSEGLTDLAHTKAGREPGYGIIGALSEIKPGSKIESIYGLADTKIEERKKGNEQPKTTQETGIVSPGEPAGTTGGSAAAEAQNVRTGTIAEPAATTEPQAAVPSSPETSGPTDLIQPAGVSTSPQITKPPEPAGALPSTPADVGDGGVSVAPPTSPTAAPVLTPTPAQTKQAGRFARSKGMQDRLSRIEGDSIPASTFTPNQQQSLDRVVVRSPEGNFSRADLEALKSEKKAAVPLNKIQIKYNAIDKDGKQITVTAPADQAIKTVDRNIEAVRRMKECLLK